MWWLDRIFFLLSFQLINFNFDLTLLNNLWSFVQKITKFSQKFSRNEINSRFIEVASFFCQISTYNRSSQIVQWVNISRSFFKRRQIYKFSVIFQIMARGQQKIQAQQKAAEKAAKLKKAAGNSKADNLKTAQAGLKSSCKVCMVRKCGYFLIFLIWIDSGVKIILIQLPEIIHKLLIADRF